MVRGKWFPMGSDISEALHIRSEVFGLGEETLDSAAQQVVVYREGSPVGSARLYWADGAFRLDRLGVLPEERNKGFGDLLRRFFGQGNVFPCDSFAGDAAHVRSVLQMKILL